MSHEQSCTPRPHEVFDFTEQEGRSYRVTRKRFEELVGDERTTIHEISEDCNNYGEFLFVATSRASKLQRVCVTFFGLGYVRP